MRSFIFSKHHVRGRNIQIKKPTPMIGYKKRNAVLERMGFPSYKAYLRSPMWKLLRSIVLETTPNCEICQKAKATQVHHLSYNRSTMMGKFRHKLVAICRGCHMRVEFRRDGTKRGVEGTMKYTRRLLRRVKRWLRHTRKGAANESSE